MTTSTKKTSDDPGEEALKCALKSSLASKQNDLRLSKEEANQLENAFGSEEFRKLMMQYVSEISDPKHRAEQDAYLKQLEEQNEAPVGKQVLRPKPGFVLKFKQSKKDGGTSKIENQKPSKKKKFNKKNNSKLGKLFINVVYSDQVGKPTSQEADSQELIGKGRYWSLPYSLGPLRMERDASKQLVPTFDCCFNPESLALSARSQSFNDLIASTAREAANRCYKKMNNNADIYEPYHILKGCRYKSGDPPIMLIDDASWKASALVNATTEQTKEIEMKEFPEELLPVSSNTSMTQVEVKVQKVPDVTKNIIKKSSVNRGFLLNPCKSTSRKSQRAVSNSLMIENQSTSKDGGVVIPHYTVVERGQFKLIDHTVDALRRSSTRPQFIEYRISLPQVKSFKNVELDVSSKRLALKSLSTNSSSTERKYCLKVDLPYPVMCDDGVAKFDKASSTLTVTLPVHRPPHHGSSSEPTQSSICEEGFNDKVSKVEFRDVKFNNPSITDLPKKEERNTSVNFNSLNSENSLTESPVLVENSSSTTVEVEGNHSRWLNANGNDNNVSTRNNFACSEELPAYRLDSVVSTICHSNNTHSKPVTSCNDSSSNTESILNDIDISEYEIVESPLMAWNSDIRKREEQSQQHEGNESGMSSSPTLNSETIRMNATQVDYLKSMGILELD